MQVAVTGIFIYSLRVIEMMPAQNLAVTKKIHGVVDRGAAYVELRLDITVKFIDVKMRTPIDKMPKQ